MTARAPVKRASELGGFEIRVRPPKGIRHTAYGTFRPGQNVDGYGTAISSDYEVRLVGEMRWRRVYVTQISNAGSTWVLIRKEKYHFNDGDFDEARDAARIAAGRR